MNFRKATIHERRIIKNDNDIGLFKKFGINFDTWVILVSIMFVFHAPKL